MGFITRRSRGQELKGRGGLETSESGGHTPLLVGATLSSPLITTRSREQELKGGGGLETSESGGGQGSRSSREEVGLRQVKVEVILLCLWAPPSHHYSSPGGQGSRSSREVGSSYK